MESLFASVTNKRRQLVVEKLIDTNRTITNTTPNEIVFITQCVNSKIDVNSRKCCKVQIDSCKNCVITIDCVLITGTAELINCDQCIVSLNGTIYDVTTVTLDQTKSTVINLMDGMNPPHQIKFLSSYDCKENSVYVRKHDITHEIEWSEDEDEEDSYISKSSIQYQSRFLDDSFSELASDKLLREGCGYVTTKREKEINDEKQRRIEEHMERLIEETISLYKQKEVERENIVSDHPSTSLLDQIQKFNKNELNSDIDTKVTSLTSVLGDMDIESSTFLVPSSIQTSEIFDSEDTIIEKVKLVAQEIRNSNYVCVYTGAGISTSANIPDYRGPQGIWTLKEQGRLHEAKKFDIEMAYPTYTHYALCTLMKNGLIHYVVSTNVDGLHRRSGLKQNELSELHGNCYREVCSRCNAEYLRPFDVSKTVRNYMDHLTQRKCDECNGNLKDTIIHFSESLNPAELNPAIDSSKRADVTLVLGTSMKVQPACSLPMLNPNAKMYIVNLQKTPYNHKAEKVIHSRTDFFMETLMKELGLHDQVDMSYDELEEIRRQNPDHDSLNTTTHGSGMLSSHV
jgi:mono-ADP-ribosyltransferase sirtuin 6